MDPITDLQPAAPPARAVNALLWIAMATAIVFIVVAAMPYLLSAEYRAELYSGRRAWLLVHIWAGMAAILSGPVQLWLGLTQHAMHWHRILGVAYLSAVAVGSLAAFYLALNTPLGFIFGAGLTGLAIAWVSTSALALLAIRRRRIHLHREWMIRSYVVTFAFVFFRMIVSGMEAGGIGTLSEQLATASWACWAIPLLVTELLLQGRKVLASQRVPAA